MTSAEFESEDNNTIQRCPHDKENPYSQINRDLIRDQSISPECRWLIIYLLSNKSGWKISLKQIQEHVKPHMGRDRVRKMFNEAIEAGYILREDYSHVLRREDGSYKGVFRRVRYFISEQPKFKKCLPRSDFQRAENPGAENLTDKEIALEKKEHKEELSVVGAGAPPSKSSEEEQSSSSQESHEKKQEIPKKAVVLQNDGSRLVITESQLYERIVRSRCDFSSDAIRYAWQSLCQYEGVVHDWWRFIEGTATNYQRKKKSQQIGRIECQRNATQRNTTRENRSLNHFKEDSSGKDSSTQTSQKSKSIMDCLRELQDSSKTPQNF